MNIPPFDDGALPPGDYDVTIDEIEASYLVTGRGLARPGWDVERRRMLVVRLRRVAELLRGTGMVSALYVDGSFVQMANTPTDIDCYFELLDVAAWEDGLLEAKLQELDPHGGWSWDPAGRVSCGAKTPKLPFWREYLVDLFPEVGDPCGIRSRDGRELTFAQAFRQRTDTGAPKGILRVRLT